MATDIIARGMAANAKKSVTELDNKIESEKWIGTKAEWEAVDKSTIKDGTIVYITDDKTVILYDKAEMEKIAAKVAEDRIAAETAAQTAQSIADSLPEDYTTAVGKIVENTAEIANLKLTDKELQRRVNALYDMGQGITHQFETDTDTAYQKAVPTGAKLMSVKSVGGRSVVFNQLIPDSIIHVTVTIDEDVTEEKWLKQIVYDTSPIARAIGHKVVGKCIRNTSNPNAYVTVRFESLNVNLSNGSGCYTDTETGIYTLSSGVGNPPPLYFRAFAGATAGTYKFTLQLFDLTAMFGAGNEPVSVEEFEKMFPADYYPYNAGEIVSAGTESVVEQGKNLWDEVWGVGSISPSSGNNEGGTATIYSKNYIPIIPNSTYIFVYAGSTNIAVVRVRFYDHNKKFIGIKDNNGQIVYPNRTFITPSNAFYVRFTLPVEYGNVYKNDIVLIAGSSGNYAPYHSNVYHIPDAIKALPGYGVEGNTVDYETKTYTQNNAIDGTEIKALDTPIVTDISSLIPDDFLRNIEVEAGGSVTFKNGNDSYRIPVPSEEEYIVKLSEVGGTT